MGFNDIDIKVSGGSDIISTLQTYTTKILKPNIVDGKNVLTQEMLSSKNTKYVIKYVYELLGTTLTMPQNVILEFDGGSIKNGTLVGNDTLMLNTNETESVLDNVTLNGTWKESSYDLVEEVVADKAPGDGMGRIILRKDKTFAEQLTQENTIYVIRYDFELTEDVTIPANCVLQFEGGSLSGAYTIIGTNTSIDAGLVQIFNTDIILSGTWNVTEAYPEWFGAKGDGVTDDTDAFTLVKTLKHIRLSNKTYCIRNVTFEGHCSVKGCFRESTILKQIDGSEGDFITLLNCDYSIFESLTIAGGKNIVEVNEQQALLKVRTTNQSISTWGTLIQNIGIRDSEYNGAAFLGEKNVQENAKGNWIFTVTNLFVVDCKRYCVYNNSTDNLFSNLYLGRGGWANLLDEGSSCMWSNAKLDGYNAGYTDEVETDDPVERLNSTTGYALMILREINLSSYNNFDIQSAAYTGIKVIDAYSINLVCSTNNCAYYVIRDGIRPTNEKTQECYNYPGLYLKNVVYSSITYRALKYRNQYQAFRANGENNLNTLIINDNIYQGATNSYYPLYAFDLSRFKLNNKVVDANSLNTSINNRKVKNILTYTAISSETFYGDVDETGKVFGGVTPSIHLHSGIQSAEIVSAYRPKLYPNNAYLFAAVVYVESPYSGEFNVTKEPYFNIVGIPGNTILSVARLGRDRQVKHNLGERYLIFTLVSNQTDEIKRAGLNILAITDGSYYVANIVCYNVTRDLGCNFAGNIYQNNGLISTVFTGNESLLEGNTEFRDLECIVESSNYTTTDSGKLEQAPQNPCDGYLYFNTDINKPVYRKDSMWIESDGAISGVSRSGATTSRPSSEGIYAGFQYFDITLNKPIYWTGSAWVDATGTTV